MPRIFFFFCEASFSAAQDKDADLRAEFAPIAEALSSGEEAIVAELNGVQGKPVDIGDYYLPDFAKTSDAMRPSATLNGVIG